MNLIKYFINRLFLFLTISVSLGIVAIVIISLSGCSSLEKKSSDIPKKELTQLNQNIKYAYLWDNKALSKINKNNISIGKSGNAIFSADYKGNVIALNKFTGKTIWETNVGKVVSGPAVDKDLVIVVGDRGKVTALNIRKGNKVWTYNSNSEILASPNITDNMAFLHTLDGRVIAINIDNGREMWSYSYTIPQIILRKSSSPVVIGNVVIAGLANGKLIALNKISGQPHWLADLSRYNGEDNIGLISSINSKPYVENGMVYAVAYKGKLAAASLYSGEIAWDKSLSSYSGLVVDKNRVIVAQENGDLTAFDSSIGNKIWNLKDFAGRKLTKPVIYKNNVVVADEDGFIHFVSSSNGKIVGRINVDEQGINTSPSFEKNIMYVLGNSGKISAIKLN